MPAVGEANPVEFRRVASGYHPCGLALPEPGQAGPGDFFLMILNTHTLNHPLTPTLASDKLRHSQIGQEQVGSERGLQATQLRRWTKAHCAQVTVTL